MTAQTNKKAVIYCRVSSTRQVTHGNGLESQESRCTNLHNIADMRSFSLSVTICQVRSLAVLACKPALKYLRSNRKKELIVIIDDISRLARGLEAHLQLQCNCLGWCDA